MAADWAGYLRCWFKTVSYMALLLTVSVPALAVVDIREFKTDADEQRYQLLMDELRCPKCQNQNLAGSDSQIAADLRRELYRLIDEGESNKEIKTFMVDRYGDYILYRPRLNEQTLVLWFGPAVLLLIGGVVLFWILRKQSAKVAEDTPNMSAEEKQKLQAMIKDTE